VEGHNYSKAKKFVKPVIASIFILTLIPLAMELNSAEASIVKIQNPFDTQKQIAEFGENVKIVILGHTTDHHGPEKGSATLTGAQENPPVDTGTTGSAKFSHNKATDPLKFSLVVKNGQQITAAHIHCAAMGFNGPIGATLYPNPSAPLPPFTTSGGGKALVRSSLAAPDADNACGFADLNALLAAMRTGDTYVNVHTTGNLGGEVRGQISYM